MPTTRIVLVLSVRRQNIPLGHSVSLSSLRRAGPQRAARPHGEARKPQAVAVDRSRPPQRQLKSARGCLTYLREVTDTMASLMSPCDLLSRVDGSLNVQLRIKERQLYEWTGY
jgi:hypothetical protein